MILDEFRSYTGFNTDDEELLRSLWPHVEPRQEEFVTAFYERITDHASTRDLMSDSAQVERLMGTLKVWMRELLMGPWDECYVSRRRRIGLVHDEVGVDISVVSMAMGALQGDLIRAAAECDDPVRTGEAIRKVTMLDLGLMTSSYHTSHEEQRVRDARALLVAHLPAVAFLVGVDGTVQSSTTAASWLFTDTEPETDIGSMHFRDVLPPAIVEEASLDKYIARAVRTGNDVKLPRVDAKIRGESHHLSITIVPFADPEPGAILYIENHTVAVEAERRLQQAEHLAVIGTLSATIAHELRNPLAGISGALQVIASGFAEDDRRRAIIAKILDQVRALNWMVTDLLAYARPDKLQKEDGIDLAALCEAVVDNIRDDHPNVEFRIHGEASAAVDPNGVRQILLNLAINACQAMGGEGAVAFNVHPDHVTVCDSGPGLPESVRKRIFEPFFTTKLKGTGLGLPISLKLARAMGGDLRPVDDGALGGACFTLWLRRPPSI